MRSSRKRLMHGMACRRQIAPVMLCMSSALPHHLMVTYLDRCTQKGCRSGNKQKHARLTVGWNLGTRRANTSSVEKGSESITGLRSTERLHRRQEPRRLWRRRVFTSPQRARADTASPVSGPWPEHLYVGTSSQGCIEFVEVSRA